MKSLITFSFLMLTSISFSQAEIERGQPAPPSKTEAEPVKDEEEIHEKASFPGGIEALYEFISSKYVLPEEVKKKKLKGEIMLQFVVTSSGVISNVKVLNTTDCPACEQEAIRLLGRMPKWKPATINGKAISSMYKMPIKYTYKK